MSKEITDKFIIIIIIIIITIIIIRLNLFSSDLSVQCVEIILMPGENNCVLLLIYVIQNQLEIQCVPFVFSLKCLKQSMKKSKCTLYSKPDRKFKIMPA